MDALAKQIGLTTLFSSLLRPTRLVNAVWCDTETVDLVARIFAADFTAFGFNLKSAYDSCSRDGLTSPL